MDQRDALVDLVDSECLKATAACDARERKNNAHDQRVRSQPAILAALGVEWASLAEYESTQTPDAHAERAALLEDYYAELARIAEERQAIEAERDRIVRCQQQAGADAPFVIVGPAIEIQDLPDALLAGPDSVILKREAEFRASEQKDAELAADHVVVTGKIARLRDQLEALKAEQRAGASSATELKAATTAMSDANAVLTRIAEQRALGATRRDAIRVEIRTRRETLDKEFQARLAKEEQHAREQANAAVIAAMQKITCWHRVRRLSGSDLPRFASLDADEPQSFGRQWLQKIAEHRSRAR